MLDDLLHSWAMVMYNASADQRLLVVIVFIVGFQWVGIAGIFYLPFLIRVYMILMGFGFLFYLSMVYGFSEMLLLKSGLATSAFIETTPGAFRELVEWFFPVTVILLLYLIGTTIYHVATKTPFTLAGQADKAYKKALER